MKELTTEPQSFQQGKAPNRLVLPRPGSKIPLEEGLSTERKFQSSIKTKVPLGHNLRAIIFIKIET